MLPRYHVILMCGLPGSGKSTFAAKLASSFPSCSLLSFDQLEADILEEHGYSVAQRDVHYTEVWLSVRERGLKRVEEALEGREGAGLIVDDNFYYSSMRKQVYQLCRRHEAVFSVCFLDTPLSLCLERDQGRGDLSVGSAAIEKMHGRFEPPPARPFEEGLVFLVSEYECSDQAVLRLLEFVEGLDPPAASVEEAKENPASFESRLHQLDLGLRAIVSRVMQQQAPGDKRVVAEMLAKAKKRALREAREEEEEAALAFRGENLGADALLAFYLLEGHELEVKVYEDLPPFMNKLLAWFAVGFLGLEEEEFVPPSLLLAIPEASDKLRAMVEYQEVRYEDFGEDVLLVASIVFHILTCS